MYYGTRSRSAKFTRTQVWDTVIRQGGPCLSVRQSARAGSYKSERFDPHHHTTISHHLINTYIRTTKRANTRWLPASKLCCILCLLDIFCFENGQKATHRQRHQVHRRQECCADSVLEEVRGEQQGARQDHQDDLLRQKRGPKQSWQCGNVRESAREVQLVEEIHPPYYDCDRY